MFYERLAPLVSTYDDTSASQAGSEYIYYNCEGVVSPSIYGPVMGSL